jgi:SAM-dependent methyltransferase
MSVDERKPSSAYLLSEIGIEDEAARLRAQASIMLAKELPGILRTIPTRGRFVDLGCGAGLLADAVAQARPDVEVWGFDADGEAVAVSRRHFGGRAGIRFDCRRVEEGPPPEFPRADAAVLRLVLMHLPDPLDVLGRIKAWLRPGAVLHVLEGDDRAVEFEPALPNLDGVLSMMQMVQVHKGGSRHLGRSLERLLAAAGYRVQGMSVHTPDPQATAEAVPRLFFPVAEFYLSEAGRLKLASADRLESLVAQLRNPPGAPLKRAVIPLFHAWANTSEGTT